MNIFALTTILSIALTVPVRSQESKPDQAQLSAHKEEPTSRTAIVTRKNGSFLKGKIVQQTESTVTLDSDGVAMSIPAESVISIVYEGASAQVQSQPLQDIAQLKKALQVIRKLTVATGLGIAYKDYGSLMIQVQTDATNILIDAPSGSGKSELEASLKNYAVAGRIWDNIWKADYLTLMNMSKEEKAFLDNNYQVPIKKQGFLKVYFKNDILASIWAVAKKHFNEAERLIERSGVKE
jgi:hypothetical protein